MNAILSVLALLASVSPSVAATPASLEAAKAAGLPLLSIQEARSRPSPASVAGAPLCGLAAGMELRHTSISNLDVDASLFFSKDYQLGDEWGKKVVTAESLAKESAVFARAAKATARFGGATAFYLGKFNGRHMMATNNHVLQRQGCDRFAADFVLIGRRFQCEKSYGNWKEVDLALFSIRVSPNEEAALAGLGGNFAFDAEIYPGQELLTVGFGVSENKARRLVANQDSDCKVFSGRNEFRLMADPDDYNPGPDEVWSFASACDISHGDSGSAFVDRKTGETLGIVWTGRIPKSPQVGSSKYLAELLARQGPEIWTELSYTVPAARIRDSLLASLNGGRLGSEEAGTIRALLGLPGPPAVAKR